MTQPDDHARRGLEHLGVALTAVGRYAVWFVFAVLLLVGAIVLGTLLVGIGR
ncbi:MAG: hypothetical protein JWM05_2944 [Acidimicrobiales bacterium]|nr:hypothetical protein [Acidimicrobiales bacterium]